MYILKNAVLSIRRNKGRNLLIGMIFIVIACASAVTLAIRNSANSLIKSYEDSYEITATIEMNRQSFMQDFNPENDSMEDKVEQYNNIEAITLEDIENYQDSKYVSSYYYTYQVGLDSSNIDKVTSEIENDSSNDNKGPGKMGQKEENNFSDTDFTIIGYSSQAAMTDFVSGNYQITDGSVFDDFESNGCIINEELATSNNLSVGDTITFYNPDNKKLTYELEIVGIYTDNSKTDDNKMNMFSNSANSIITNTTVVENIVNDDEDIMTSIDPTFILTSQDVIEDFEKELTEKGLNEYFSVSTNLDQIESETSSITNVKTFATTFLIITLLIGGIVLFVINMINVRERKYEIGVLRTIGMKKSILTCQFMIEILIVAMLSLVIGTAIGASISVPVANNLLASEIESSQENMQQVSDNFGGPRDDEQKDMKKDDMKFNGVVSVDKITSINAVVDIKVILELIMLGLILSLVSALASMISIQRFSPLTILKERS
jgi:putative ABC transport system permease protein